MSSPNKSVIVSGEASETESDDEETNKSPKKVIKSIQGEVITGEDSESETEHTESVSSTMSTSPKQSSDQFEYSLLHKKLYETNRQLREDIETFVDSTVFIAEKNLSSLDQQLLKSQLTLQSAITSLKALNAHSLQMRNKLNDALAIDTLKNVNCEYSIIKC